MFYYSQTVVSGLYMAVVKEPLDARERSSCTSNYWDPAFPHLKFHLENLWAHNHLLHGSTNLMYNYLTSDFPF